MKGIIIFFVVMFLIIFCLLFINVPYKREVNAELIKKESVVNYYDTVINFIKKKEGFRSKPYCCPAGYKTIGYGHLMKENENFIEVNKVQADSLLKSDFNKRKDIVSKHLPNLKEKEHLAISHFIFCLGTGKLNYIKKNFRNKLKLISFLKSHCKYKQDTILVFSNNLLEQRNFEIKLINGDNN
jgi:GH24 family phage-related lysozyme (muramidase)